MRIARESLLGSIVAISVASICGAQIERGCRGLMTLGGGCIEFARTDSEVTQTSVRNKCDRPFTLVLYTVRGTEVINVPPGVATAWTSPPFDRWKLCDGISNVSCQGEPDIPPAAK